ncbi:MAG: DUF2125 domain-containing protein [Alphaproteobacteria bacterium]|nr:DUF2125 domain-containing protein [Alphaproteobacteria bacterium]
MKPAPFSPRTIFIATLTFLVTLSVIGWGLWSFAAVQYRHVIDGWITEGRAAGYQISYDDRTLFGFPRHITMRFVNLRWKNADGIAFRADDMDLAVTPWNWRQFTAKFKHNVSVTAPLDTEGHALLVSCDAGQAHVLLDQEGFWKSAHLALDKAQVGLAPSYLFTADELHAAVEKPLIPPKDHSESGLSLEGDAEDITLPEAMPTPFGKHADTISASMRVMGAVPDVRKRADVDAWNKASGVVEFDDLSIHWGKLDIVSKGTLGFDDDLQPEGAFAGQVADPKDTMQTLIDQGFIAMHDQDMLKAVMEMFAKPPAGKDAKAAAMQLPITVQLGGLFLGPIRIFTFPEIDWPVEPPAATAAPATPTPPPAT